MSGRIGSQVDLPEVHIPPITKVLIMAFSSPSRRRKGFSLIEVIAAVVILAVVATATVSTIAPMREKSRVKLDEQNIAKLNGIVQAYILETGQTPDYWMTRLQTAGYTTDRLQPTPYGGNYSWDAANNTVVNNYSP